MYGGRQDRGAIIETLDKHLPKNIKFHLFGVEGGAVKDLGGHHGLHSIDSMAHDCKLRCQVRTRRTQAMRDNAMVNRQDEQERVVPKDRKRHLRKAPPHQQ